MNSKKMCKPFLKWVGGKSQILDIVINKFPKSMKNYHEPFLGGGSVLLELLHKVNKNEICIEGDIKASDSNPYLIGLYKNIQKNYDDFLKSIEILIKNYNSCEELNGNRKPKNLQEALTSKESYYYWIRDKFNKEKNNNNIETSAMFLFLNKTGFRGLYREGPNGFNVPFGNYKNPSIIDKENLEFIHNLIQNVEFNCQDFSKSLMNCNEDDFVYLDPPYAPENSTSFVNYTENGFSLNKHKELFETIHHLAKNKVNILMSNSDVDLVKNEFNNDNYVIKIIECKRAIHSKKPDSKTNEVLIQNVLKIINNLEKNKKFKVIKNV